jgi:transposase
MRTGIKFEVSPSDRLWLEQVVRDRNAPQKHVWRASIILLSTGGVGTAAIMRQTGKSKTCVWRWQERFMAAGAAGLLRDKTRPSRIAPLKPDVIERVVALTLTDAPGETTHWTSIMMAAASKISASAVRRIWKAHGCGSACKRDPLGGVIGVQQGPLISMV